MDRPDGRGAGGGGRAQGWDVGAASPERPAGRPRSLPLPASGPPWRPASDGRRGAGSRRPGAPSPVPARRPPGRGNPPLPLAPRPLLRGLQAADTRTRARPAPGGPGRAKAPRPPPPPPVPRVRVAPEAPVSCPRRPAGTGTGLPRFPDPLPGVVGRSSSSCPRGGRWSRPASACPAGGGETPGRGNRLGSEKEMQPFFFFCRCAWLGIATLT